MNRKKFEISARRDRDKYGGGLIEFVRKGFISQESREYEAQNCEKEHICFSIYRSPTSTNIDLLFEDIIIVINKPISNYENVIIIGHVNNYVNSSGSDKNKLESFLIDINICQSSFL